MILTNGEERGGTTSGQYIEVVRYQSILRQITKLKQHPFSGQKISMLKISVNIVATIEGGAESDFEWLVRSVTRGELT